jgi:serine/threonine-protein kinase
MGNEVLVRSLLEEVLNSGRTPEEVCSSHPEILEQVRTRWLRVRGLLSDLEELLPSAGLGGARGPAGGAPEAKPLPRIPGYELNAVIGHGGMGVVYEATHLKLNRIVAVKMLLAGDFASSKELESLLREARTVAGLGHPNIVEVFDAGEVDGRPYFTMEYVDGGSLAEKLDGAPLPVRDAAVLVERLSAAVHVAHERGVVHRDLKPANILLTSDATPKITDFGLARRTEGDSQRTTGSARFGTPSYMAPEQALGIAAAFHPSVDVYALGAILYETLTGRPPFRADSPLETQRQVISDDPVAPSHVNRRVPRDLETVCLKCLRKNPAARYASAGRLNEDLNRYLRGEPIAARKTSAVVRLLKWARRHPATTTALGFCALLAVAVVIGAAWYVATAQAGRRIVENDLEEVTRDQAASNWAAANAALDRASLRLGQDGPVDLRERIDIAHRNDGFVKRLEAIRMTRALESGSPEAFAKSDREYADLYRDAAVMAEEDSPEQVAQNLRASGIGTALIGGMYDWLVSVIDDERQRRLLSVLRIADSDHGGWRDRSLDPAVWNDRDALNRLIAETKVADEPTDRLLWFVEAARQLGADSLPLLRRIQAAHCDDFWANYMLAEALHGRGQDMEGVRYIQSAIAIRPDVAVGHSLLGNYLRALYRPAESLDALETAARLNPSGPKIRGNLGLTLAMLGRPADALEQVELALQQRPDDAMLHANRGAYLLTLGRESEAVEEFKRTASMRDTGMARSWLIMGLIRSRQGPEAVEAFRSSIGNRRDRYEAWDGLAELCLYVEVGDEYENARGELIEAFGSSSDPVVCEKLCRACMLASIAEDDWKIATAAIDRALEGEKHHATWRGPYFRLVKAMSEYRAGRPDEVLRLVDAKVSNVLAPLPQLIRAMALADLRRTGEAMALLAQAAVHSDWRPTAASSTEAWLVEVIRREAESKVLPDLDAFLRRTYWPSGGDERTALIATSEDRRMRLEAARLFAEAFKATPALAEDVAGELRYRAACAAAACSCGGTSEVAALSPEEKGRWRAQCLQWLRAELGAVRERMPRTTRVALLSKWRNEIDFRGIRDPALLAALPENERSAFNAFWAEVDGVLTSRDSN